MNFGFYLDKPTSISSESHLSAPEQEPTELLLKIRDVVRLQGGNIVQGIRPHRVVYTKSLAFRAYLDNNPRSNDLIISIRKSRTEPCFSAHYSNFILIRGYQSLNCDGIRFN